MKRRSFLAMLGLAPVAAMTGVSSVEAAKNTLLTDGTIHLGDVSISSARIENLTVGTLQIGRPNEYLDRVIADAGLKDRLDELAAQVEPRQ